MQASGEINQSQNKFSQSVNRALNEYAVLFVNIVSLRCYCSIPGESTTKGESLQVGIVVINDG